jgi:predicted dehydrogenase
MAVAALNAGKHVMCEKPMAIAYAEAQAMVDAAERAHKVLTIGYQGRFRPDSQYLKHVCDQGGLGRIYFAKALAVRRRGIPTSGVFLSKADQGGGPLIDIGTHALDLTLWCMNNYAPQMVVGTTFAELGTRPDVVNTWGPWDASQFSVEDAAFGYIKMQNGALIWLEASWALNTLEAGEAQTLLCGTVGGADMRDGLRLNGVEFGALIEHKPDLRGRGFDYASVPLEAKPEETEAREFIRAVREEAEPLVKPRQAAVVTRILEALYQSAAANRPVWLETEPSWAVPG